jgi:hypothetical protein
LAAPFEQVDEAANVRYWLIGQLMELRTPDKAGLRYAQARNLVEDGLDGEGVRRLGRLLEAGCPLVIAVELVRP